ncbi:rootletin-like [Dendronephthya gigantea]|uniref:rootletin-like n=1 Tax=Dendronephthya gigantea TaxID=151771 RepID=UPI00106D1630|nr:rootletin-like [Dendronephthya gigantea]
MPLYNNNKHTKRLRGNSCPAGVSFEYRNDIKKDGPGPLQKSKSTNFIGLLLEKEHNLVRERRQSLPDSFRDELSRPAVIDEKHISDHFPNYSSRRTGGSVHNSFYSKLVPANSQSHSSADASNQHTKQNKSPVHRCFAIARSFLNEIPFDISSELRTENRDIYPTNLTSTNEIEQAIKKSNEDPLSASLKAVSHSQNDTTLLNTCESAEYSHCSSFKSSSTEEKSENPGIILTFQSPDLNKTLPTELLKSFENIECIRKTHGVLSSSSGNGKPLNDAFLGTFFEEVSNSEVDELLERFNRLIQKRDTDDLLDSQADDDVKRLESSIKGTELLVESLAAQVEETKSEIEMSNQKQGNEINELVSFNEEIHSILSAKESEIREILERFSTYRDAVEADTKEKDEIYSEETSKREALINELQLTRDALLEQLTQQTQMLREIIFDAQTFEATHVEQLGDVHQLVAGLLEKFSDQEASLVCQRISVKLETSIATIKEKDYTRYVSCLDISELEEKSSEELKENYRSSKLGKSLSSSVDEGTGYSIMSSSDGERNDSTLTDNEPALNNERVGQGKFSSDNFISGSLIGTKNDDLYETFDEDFTQLLRHVDEFESDNEALNGYIDKKLVAKLLEELYTKFQFICKEKDAEIQHWIKKHKQDTNDLHGTLEELEREDEKNRECVMQLQNEIEKLQQRNKFLESEVEFEKEQGEDDVCYLKESFQKDLSAQLRRQSQTFLCVEESARNELAEMESKNEELEKVNDDLRRKIDQQCSEMKSWASDMLILSEEEYHEEFNSITEVLAKLHKIIKKNKSTVAELQEELDEYKRKAYELSSSPEVLAGSLGGNSWNSMELQKDLCRNCKQVKWQRVLKGSFDLVDSSLEGKQDEVERLVNKLSIDEMKHRKKHSLKDSLELADDQFENLQRLSRHEFGSLGTLGEDSLEDCSEIDFSAGDSTGKDVVDGLGASKLEDDELPHDPSLEQGDEASNDQRKEESNSTSKAEANTTSGVAANTVENLDESWKSIHVSPRLSSQYSIRSDPEFNGLHRDLNLKGSEHQGTGATDVRGVGLESVEEISEGEEIDGGDHGERLMNEDNSEKTREEDEDRVNVVNLYRSLVLESDMPQHGNEVRGISGEHRDKVGVYGDKSGKNGEQSGDNQYGYNHDNELNHPSMFSRDQHFQIPKIVVGKDFNGNFLVIHEEEEEEEEEGEYAEENDLHEVSEDTDHPASETALGECNGEVGDQGEEYGDEIGECIDESGDYIDRSAVKRNTTLLEDEDIFHPVSTDNVNIQSLARSKNDPSESFSTNADDSNSIFEFAGDYAEGIPPPPKTCFHCSENVENLKAKLIEIVTSQRRDQDDKIFQELEDTREELRECRSENEKLDKNCEDYRNFVDEYSRNLERKNQELRELKLSSLIMKTEIEWLRQALGITRNYTES